MSEALERVITEEQDVTDEHISLNMREHLEERLRELLHDIANTSMAVTANADQVSRIYGATDDVRVGTILDYLDCSNSSIDKAIKKIREVQSLVRRSYIPEEAVPLSVHMPLLKLTKEYTVQSRGYLENAELINRANDDLHILQQEAQGYMIGAKKGNHQMCRLISHAQYLLRKKQTEYCAVRTDLSSAIEEALEIYAGSLQKERIQTELQVQMRNGAPRPFYFIGDSLRMTQVVINILSNMKYELRQANHPLISIGINEAPDNQVRISIANNGPPIRDTEAIFEKGRSGRGSSGLGLPICRNIVGEKFGGRIYAKNTPRGAAFYIEIPSVD